MKQMEPLLTRRFAFPCANAPPKGALAKRLFDLFLVLLLLPIVVPLIALLYGLVRSDGGAGFFAHERVGQNGKLFNCWKIRTMVPDAQKRLKTHLASDPTALEEWQRCFKLTNDPRITPFGRFLRETSLDELPQIWNVLRGEMSFVGPRPVTHDELGQYGQLCHICFREKPGITGIWQVSGRNDLSYKARVDLDLDYARNRSMLGDVVILLKTAGILLSRNGR